MLYKGVVFDFNGTLFLDTELHNRAWDIFLDKHGFKLSDSDKNRRIHGKNNRDIMGNLFGADLSSEKAERFIQEKEAIYRNICLQLPIELAPGAVEFFRFLIKNQTQYTIATASMWENVIFYFDKLNLNKWFDIDKIVYDDGTNMGKPAPDFFLKACTKLQLPPKEVIVFEDSYFGIKAAENAKVGKIIIMASNTMDYEQWNYQKIKNYDEVDKKLFKNI
ncbi:MAG: HAD family phosphatase [Desulfobacteraceae bacterium]|jgi:beta-phosphoglucomutase-like phosphatase (HAD superfamily)